MMNSLISWSFSSLHILCPHSDAGNQDRVVIQELIKTVAQSQQIQSSTQREFKGRQFRPLQEQLLHLTVNLIHSCHSLLSVVLLTEVDRLTKDAQHALRRTMEKYMATCRLILCSTSTSKVIGPIRSRCLAIRVPLPSTEEVSWNNLEADLIAGCG